MKRHITIKEIAAEAGVSIATVSIVLNKKDKKISEATRKRILDIAGKYNYTPNGMARSLVTKKTETIGLIIPDIVNPFFPEIARGVEDKASEFGYSVIYCNTDDKIKRENKYIDILTEKAVDGIIFARSAGDNGGVCSLEKCKVPIVLIDRDYEEGNVIGKILVDNKSGTYDATLYLLDRGYKNIAYIAGDTTINTAADRLEGYKKALLERNMPVNEEYIKIGDYRMQWGIDAVSELIEQKLPIDCIFCGNDIIAIGAVKKLREKGLRVPQDIGVVGFDDIYLAGLTEPALTTVKQPIYEMGYKAAELLINRLRKEPDEDNTASGKKDTDLNTMILTTELVVRMSTK